MGIIYYQMSTNTDFPEWLQERLKLRDMTQADLARESGLTSAAISRIMNGSRRPGPDACRAIAKALEMEEVDVFRQAGLLSPEPEESGKPEEPPNLREWVRIFLKADESERDRMIDVAKTLLRESKK